MATATDATGVLTDLYELTMAQAYLDERMLAPATFSLFVRRLPPQRKYVVSAGLEDALDYLERLRFGPEELEYLRGLGLFRDSLLEWLARFRFEGDVWAVPEGTIAFENEPLLEVTAPLPAAQLVETMLVNRVHLSTVIASKAARVVEAAQGRTLVDFGLRRTHGLDAGMQAARASFLAGFDATSNVLAGMRFGIPVSGTMAHSYVQAHASELEAFRAFTQVYPRATLLVDTYDTLGGIRNVIRLARERGPKFDVRAVRLDSGDLVELSKRARHELDAAGLTQVAVFASGGLDEERVAACVARGAPIAGFGVGTAMGVSADAPSLDVAYKLVAYDGAPRMKLSTGKSSYPWPKQIFRGSGEDVLALRDERLEGTPLLREVMRAGVRLHRETLAEARARAQEGRRSLPAPLRTLEPGGRYPVRVSDRLAEATASLEARLRSGTPR